MRRLRRWIALKLYPEVFMRADTNARWLRECEARNSRICAGAANSLSGKSEGDA